MGKWWFYMNKENKDVGKENKVKLPDVKMPKINLNELINFLLVLGLISIFTVGFMYKSNLEVVLGMLLLGSLGFLPLGFVLGWIFLDPYMRCKVLRWIRRKNYGIVHLVGRGKQITTLIKDFNKDLIWVDNNVWIIEPNKIYKYGKEGQTYAITSKHILTLSGVPTIFLSLDSMKPLDFYEETTKIKPEEIGATLRGWVYNQYAKAMFFKRTMEIIGIVTLVLIAVALYFGYQNYIMIHDQTLPLLETIKATCGKIASKNATIVITQTP